MLIEIQNKRSLITGRVKFSDIPRQRTRWIIKLWFNNWGGHFKWPLHPGEMRWFWLLAPMHNWDILSSDLAYFTEKSDFQFGCEVTAFHYSLILRTLSLIWIVPRYMLLQWLSHRDFFIYIYLNAFRRKIQNEKKLLLYIISYNSILKYKFTN